MDGVGCFQAHSRRRLQLKRPSLASAVSAAATDTSWMTALLMDLLAEHAAVAVGSWYSIADSNMDYMGIAVCCYRYCHPCLKRLN